MNPAERHDVPTLATMNARGTTVAVAYYEAGLEHGWALGFRAAEEEFAHLHRRAHEVVQHAARTPTFAELCERRGEPDRAEANRALLRDRGIA